MGDEGFRGGGTTLLDVIIRKISREELKESLHIHLTKIVFFEINKIYSLGYGQMITQEKKT